jgi:hypothetical protein
MLAIDLSPLLSVPTIAQSAVSFYFKVYFLNLIKIKATIKEAFLN